MRNSNLEIFSDWIVQTIKEDFEVLCFISDGYLITGYFTAIKMIVKDYNHISIIFLDLVWTKLAYEHFFRGNFSRAM